MSIALFYDHRVKSNCVVIMWTGNDQNENINETGYNEQGTERLCCVCVFICTHVCLMRVPEHV